jgi:hypothetical protein
MVAFERDHNAVAVDRRAMTEEHPDREREVLHRSKHPRPP